MQIYIAYCNDRHIDPVIRVFKSFKSALEFAKEFVKENARFPEDVKEERVAGWLYYCQYSCEGDSVHVEAGELLP